MCHFRVGSEGRSGPNSSSDSQLCHLYVTINFVPVEVELERGSPSSLSALGSALELYEVGLNATEPIAKDPLTEKVVPVELSGRLISCQGGTPESGRTLMVPEFNEVSLSISNDKIDPLSI